MAKNKLAFEKDEKKSIIIALVVSIIVIIAVVLAFVAINRYKKSHGGESDVASTSTTEAGFENGESTVVVNQDELNLALNDPNASSILFKSDDEQTIIIPSGDYLQKALVIDAPYTEVTNYGTFSSITINQIASNTWTESVSGNTIVLDADASHLIIPKGITVTSVENIKSGSTLSLENQGSIGLLSLEADNSITSIDVDGELQETILYSPTYLTLSGERTIATALEVEYGAEGSSISTSIPVNISSFAGVSVEYNAGAEGSSFTMGSDVNTITLVNNTSSDISVSKADGTQENVAAGQSSTYEGTGATASEGGSNALSAETTSGTAENTQTSNTPSSGSSVSTGGSSGSKHASSGSSSSSSGGSSGSSSSSESTSGASSGGSSGSSSSGGSTSGGATNTGTTNNTTTNNTTSEKNKEDKTPDSEDKTPTSYTEDQVKKMIESAITNATKDLLTKEMVTAKINEAVDKAKAEAVDGMISEEDAKKLINKAVKEATLPFLYQMNIESFVNIPVIYAGDVGNLISVARLNQKLPNYLEARTMNGTPTFVPVVKWNNINAYSDLVTNSGIYKFEAEIPAEYTLTSDEPVINVYVGCSELKSTVVYKDELSKKVDVIQMIEPTGNVKNYLNGVPMDNFYDAYYVLHNSSAYDFTINLRYYYFDSQGNIVPMTLQSWGSERIPADTYGVIARDKMVVRDEDYTKCIVELSVDICESLQSIPTRNISILYDEQAESINVGINATNPESDLTVYRANVILIDKRVDSNGISYVPLAYYQVNTGILNEENSSVNSINISKSGIGVQGNPIAFVYESGGYLKE